MTYTVVSTEIQKQPFADVLQNRGYGCNFIKKRFQHRCFSVNIAKLFRAPFFIEHLQWLLLENKIIDGINHILLLLGLHNPVWAS